MFWNLTGPVLDQLQKRDGSFVTGSQAVRYLDTVVQLGRPKDHDGFTATQTAQILTDLFGPTNASRIIKRMSGKATALLNARVAGDPSRQHPCHKMSDLIDYIGATATQMSKRSSRPLPEEVVDALAQASDSGTTFPVRHALRAIEKVLTFGKH